jgi:CubicO group peptidase (beta-lactamase class C family)
MDAPIADALARAAAMGEIAVQVAAYLGPELIVDAWTGLADPSARRPADGDTLFPVFSVTKAATAVALHVQAERGLVDYDAPVARYWPEYAAKGKDAITVRHLLTHRSGVPQMPADVTAERLGDWDWMVGQLAAVELVFPPGTGGHRDSPVTANSSQAGKHAGGVSADSLEDGRQALAAADAHRLKAVAGLAAVKLPQHRGEDAAAGGADRVAERDA